MKIQPITRKERFLNEIVGWGETAPKNELTTEELFFSKILGRNVTLPDLSNVPRYYLFLAKIAGENVNVTPPTYTSPRLEFFLAKAAGMDVVTPVPRTREEIFWAAYAGIEVEIEGVPPLTFNAIAGTLKNYRIYGNTVNGESVGDRTRNLLDFGEWSKNINANRDNSLAKGIDSITITANSNDAFTIPYASVGIYKIYVKPNTNYLLSWVSNNNLYGRVFIFKNGIPDNTHMVSTNNNTTKYLLFGTDADTEFITLRFGVETAGDTITYSKIMLIEGSTALPYEPYGYKVPVTVNSNTTNIYLDEQLVKSGDDADYIDYATQKRYNADGTNQSVELPTLQTVEGANTLSVGTTVQPSKVMVKIGEASAYKVRYYVDDTMAMVETVSDGTNAQGFTPTKASTAQYNYTFMGWSTTKGSTTAETGILNDITADKSLYAVFSQSLRTFTVYFYNGNTLLQAAENVQYGGTATYTGETPIKDGFTFSGWQPSNVNVTADTSCYAQFVEG